MRPSKDTSCAFCGRSCGAWGEWDHFPVPRRRGGQDVQALCINCHDLKDRYNLLNWPESTLAEAQAQLHPFFNANLKQVAEWHQAVAQQSAFKEQWPSVVLFEMVGQWWPDLGFAGRALIAKMMQVADDRIEPYRKEGAA